MTVGETALTPGPAAASRAARDLVGACFVPLDREPHEVVADWRLLSEAERARAGRMRHGAARWAAARAALRRVLGRTLGITPGRVAFVTGADGRPRLAPGPLADLRFSLAHSGAFALVAVRLGHEVGADLEQVRDGVDAEGVAAVVFDERSRAAMSALATRAPREAFFRAWVRHEALAKATGLGLLAPEGAREAARFAVRDLPAPAGFVAAVASEGDDWSLRRTVVAAARRT